MKVEKLTMTRHCVGRHFIGLPDNFIVARHASAKFISKEFSIPDSPLELEVVDWSSDKKKFTSQVSNRAVEIGRERISSFNSLEVINVSPDEVLLREEIIAGDYVSEIHLLRDGIHYSIQADSYAGGYHTVEKSMHKLASYVSASASQSLGEFCIGNLSVRGQYVVEEAHIGFRSREAPDVMVAVDISSFGGDGQQPLLDRVRAGTTAMPSTQDRPTVLRQRNITVAGMKAQEWLSYSKGNDGDLQYMFVMETVKEAGRGIQSPFMHVELKSGTYDEKQNKHPNSLSEDGAQLIWDEITRSIQYRTAK